MSHFSDLPFHRLPVANPGEVSAQSMALVKTIERGIPLRGCENVAATLAASSCAQVLFAVIKRHGLTEAEARAAAGVAVSTLAAQNVFDQGKEG